MKFENTCWTSDYISGIKVFLQSLEKNQIEGQNFLEYFKIYVDLLEIQSIKFKELSTKSGKQITRDILENGFHSSKFLAEFEQNHTNLGSIPRLKRAQTESTSLVSEVKASLSLKLQSDVTIRLQDFLEDYSDLISDSRKSLTNQYNVYTKTNRQTLMAERAFIDKTRELEDINLEESTSAINQAQPEPESTPEFVAPVENPTDDEELFDFPIQIGTTKFNDIEGLKQFMANMVEEIPASRRLIPIPGINNEYFSSEAFLKWVKSNREKEDSRRKVEKFGQDMITFGLINNWNKLTVNNFASDEGFYEFTDLARYIATFEEPKLPQLEITPSEHSAKSQNFIKTTGGGVFGGLKNRFRHIVDIETLKQNADDTKKKYLDAVSKSYLERQRLESMIQTAVRRAEVFEKNRLKLIYGFSRQFNALVLEEQQKQLSAFRSVHNDFIFNEETLEYGLMKTALNKQSGWYWPKSEANFTNYGNSKAATDFEIFGTDLLNQYRELSNKDPKTKNVPFFLKTFVEELDKLNGVGKAWLNEIDILKANEVKRFILVSTPEYEKQYNSDDSEVDINYFVTAKIVSEVLTKFSTDEVVGFFKLWMLELPDSIIPFTSFDALKTCYVEDSANEAKLKILGSIPRQNLSSLLIIAQHLSSRVSNIEELIQNEKVPLYHLLIRPSPKVSYADVDDIFSFKGFCHDILKAEIQESLYKKLNELEEMHLHREKRAEESLARLKQAPKELSPSVSITSKVSNNTLTVDGLRPFKTKSPLSSPGTSPRVGRSRTNSNLGPRLRRPSDSLHLPKRTLSRNIDKEINKELNAEKVEVVDLTGDDPEVGIKQTKDVEHNGDN